MVLYALGCVDRENLAPLYLLCVAYISGNTLHWVSESDARISAIHHSKAIANLPSLGPEYKNLNKNQASGTRVAGWTHLCQQVLGAALSFDLCMFVYLAHTRRYICIFYIPRCTVPD